jgi:hypothetical protein
MARMRARRRSFSDRRAGRLLSANSRGEPISTTGLVRSCYPFVARSEVGTALCCQSCTPGGDSCWLCAGPGQTDLMGASRWARGPTTSWRDTGDLIDRGCRFTFACFKFQNSLLTGLGRAQDRYPGDAHADPFECELVKRVESGEGSNVTFSHRSATARIPIFIVARFLRRGGQPLVRAFRERHLSAL